MANLQVGVAGNGTVTVGAGASVHSPASNTLTLGTNGDERVRIDASGNFGIGVASPSEKLDVNGTIQCLNELRSTTGNDLLLNAGSANRDVKIQVNDVNVMYVQGSTSKIGVGIDSPDSKLHIHNGSAGSIAASSAANLTIESSASDYNVLQFLSPATAEQQIRYGDAGDNGAGYIAYNHGSNFLAIGVNGPETLRIDSSGHVGIGTAVPSQGGHTKSLTVSSLASAARAALNIQGNTANCHACVEMRNNGTLVSGLYSRGTDRLQFGTGSSGTVRGQFTSDGLNFGTDTAAANALDDYEEGSWTPTFLDAAGSNISGGVQASYTYYTKIGRYVHCTYYWTLGDTGKNGADISLRSLPFAPTSPIPTMGNWWYDGGGVSSDFIGGSHNMVTASGGQVALTMPSTTWQQAGHRYLQFNDMTNGRPIYGCFSYFA